MINLEANGLINWDSIFRKEMPKHEVGTYTLRHKKEGGFYLEKSEELKIPPKIYGDVPKLVDRFITTFEDRQASKKNTGIMLSGIKGSGKTLTGILLSHELLKKGVITVLINRGFSGDVFNQYMASITQPAFFLFDEFEKNFTYSDQQKLLTLFSGVIQGSKLFCLMVNNRAMIEDNFNDRPDRIYYNIHFPDLSNKALEEYLKDQLNDYSDAILHQFKNLRQTGTLLSFDMVRALVEEMNRFSTDVYDAAQYIVTPQVARNETFKLVVSKEGEEDIVTTVNLTLESLKDGPKMSYLMQASAPGYNPGAYAGGFSGGAGREEKTPEQLALEKKKREFAALVNKMELDRDDLVESDDVLKRFVFEKDDIKFVFEINASSMKDPSRSRNSRYF